MIGKRILIADDELLGAAVSTALSEAGYTVEHVLDGETALERLRNGDHDLFLIDPAARRMSGWEMLAQCDKSCGRNRVPIVVMSSHCGATSHHPVNATLVKPFDLETLLSTVAQTLHSCRAD